MAVGPAAPAGARDAAGHPGPRPRGVPDRPRRRGGRRRSRRRWPGARRSTPTWSRRWARAIGGSMRDARHPPGAGARARRHPRPAVGSGRRVHLRGPVRRRHDRHVVRARPAVDRACTPRSSTSSATPGSQSGRNFAPGARRPARARRRAAACRSRWRVLDGGARSVMHSYTEIDGVPVAADPRLLTGRAARPVGLRRHGRRRLLRGRVPAPPARGRRRPRRGRRRWRSRPASTSSCRPGDAYLDAARRGRPGRAGRRGAGRPRRPARAARRRTSSGLLDATFDDEPPTDVDLDSPEHRALAARLAEESVVLLSNDGTLPAGAARRRVAVDRPQRRPRRGAVRLLLLPQPRARAPPRASRSASRARRSARRWPPSCPGAEIVTRARLRGRRRRPLRASTRPCRPRRPPRSPCSSSATTPGCSAGAPSGRAATATTSSCPGVQRELVEAVLATGTPVVLVLLTGRPYAVDWALERCAAVVQAFFPGEEGGTGDRRRALRPGQPVGAPAREPAALRRRAAVLLPAPAAGRRRGRHQPARAPRRSRSGTGCPTRRSCTATSRWMRRCPPTGTSGRASASPTRGTGAGADVVQLYARDVVGSVTRPVAQLLGYRRVHLEPGASAVVTFSVPTDPARVLRPRPGPRGRAGRRRALGRSVLRRARDRGAPDAHRTRAPRSGVDSDALDRGVRRRLIRREVVVAGRPRDDDLAAP